MSSIRTLGMVTLIGGCTVPNVQNTPSPDAQAWVEAAQADLVGVGGKKIDCEETDLLERELSNMKDRVGEVTVRCIQVNADLIPMVQDLEYALWWDQDEQAVGFDRGSALKDPAPKVWYKFEKASERLNHPELMRLAVAKDIACATNGAVKIDDINCDIEGLGL